MCHFVFGLLTQISVMVGTLWWGRYGGGVFFFAIWDVMVENLMKGTEQKKHEFNIKKGNL